MKPRSSGTVGMMVSAVLLVALVLVVWHFRSEETPSERIIFKARRLQLVDRMRRELASASEAEKSAVMAVTDRESETYADQARDATAEIVRERTELERLLQDHGSKRELELLAPFTAAFADFQRVDRELLDLAVRNTNLKALALAFGPAADSLHEMDGALSRLMAQSAGSGAAKAKTVMAMAAGAQAAALRIAILLPPHIAEQSDRKMDELEAAMAKEHGRAQKNLEAMQSLVPGNKDLEVARSSYARFTETRSRILALSRENTNVRSLLLSLNEKRKVAVMCQDSLAALEQAIEAEPIAAPVSPR